MKTWTDEELVEIFVYLDDLRESGETNMYGASSYLVEEMSMERKQARDVLGQWMKTFSHEKSLDARVAQAQKAIK